MTLEQAGALKQRLFPEEVMRELDAKYGLEFGLPTGSYWLPRGEWKAQLELGLYRRCDPEVLARIRRFVRKAR